MGPVLLGDLDDAVDLCGGEAPAVRLNCHLGGGQNTFYSPAGHRRGSDDCGPRKEPEPLFDVALEPFAIGFVAAQQVPLVEDDDAGPARLEDLLGYPLVVPCDAGRDIDHEDGCVDPLQSSPGP